LRVEAILDRRDLGGGRKVVSILTLSSIPLFVDGSVKIAHSKILIIDAREVITGSFNFTDAAEHSNAENVLIIKNDPVLVQMYLANYQRRYKASYRID
jgi:phospholipase D